MSNIRIRAWSSEDGWYIGADERLIYNKTFYKYGMIAKICYLYAKLFYQKVIIEIDDES